MNNLIKKRYTPPSSLSTAKFLKGKERFDFENLPPPPKLDNPFQNSGCDLSISTFIVCLSGKWRNKMGG